MHFHLQLKTIMGTKFSLHYQTIYNNSFGKLLIMTFKKRKNFYAMMDRITHKTFKYNKKE